MWAFEAIEDKIIHLILFDREFAILVLNELDASLFASVTCERMLKVIKQYHNKYNGIPELDELKTLISGSTILSKNFDFVEAERIYGDMELKPSEIDFVKDSIPKFIKHSNFKKLITLASADVYRNDTPDTQEEIYNKFDEGFKKIKQYNMDKDLGVSIYDVKERYARLKNKHIGGVKPALEGLQKAIGAYYAGEVYAYLGSTGSGKSVMLVNDALAGVKQGFNVVYITLELEPQSIGLRVDQNVSSKEASILIKDNLTVANLEKKYKDIKKLTKAGDMITKQYPNYGTNCNGIRTYLEMLRMYKDYECQFLVVDYGELLSSNAERMNEYERQGAVFSDLAALAVELNIPVLTASQSNRPSRDGDGSGKPQTLDGSRIAESFKKLFPLFGCYSINAKGGQDVILNKRYLYIVKNRNGFAETKVPFIMNTMIMTIKDDIDIDEEQFE